jgi:hypothetical protein
MIVNEAAWKQLKEQIEYHTKSDTSISDISINYQVKKAKNRNYLRLNITTDD